jgi:ABC-type transporter lipoprotein component MlaA
MAVVQDEILDAFITELRERALSEFRRIEKENQDRYERVRELSMKLRDILSKFSEKNRQTIESYMEEKDSLTSDELDYVYLQGIIDCCKMLKMLKII